LQRSSVEAIFIAIFAKSFFLSFRFIIVAAVVAVDVDVLLWISSTFYEQLFLKSIDGPSKSLTGPSLLWPLIVAVPHCCGSSLLWSKTLAKLVGFMIRDFSLGNTEVESASEWHVGFVLGSSQFLLMTTESPQKMLCTLWPQKKKSSRHFYQRNCVQDNLVINKLNRNRLDLQWHSCGTKLMSTYFSDKNVKKVFELRIAKRLNKVG